MITVHRRDAKDAERLDIFISVERPEMKKLTVLHILHRKDHDGHQ